MESFTEIRNAAEAGKQAGLKPKETRSILDGSLFSESDIGLLGLLKDSMKDPQKRSKLFDILESRNQSPVPLSEIINVLDKFSNLKRKIESNLTETDIKLLRFTIKYFEDWFYAGKWTHIPERQEARPYAYFSVPAGIINMATKIKEVPECAEKIGKEGDFRKESLLKLQREVYDFAVEFLSAKRLNSIMQKGDSTDEERTAAKNILSNRDAIIETFFTSEKSVRNALGTYGHIAGDLYFLKTCLIAAEVIRRQQIQNSKHIFIPDKKLTTTRNEYVNFDFSNGEDARNNSMHYPTFRLPYCKFVVEYLRQLSN